VQRALARVEQLAGGRQGGLAPDRERRFETVGAGDELGTLEVGKLADIVLLDADPLEDIKNTQAIWRVNKGGVVFDLRGLRPSRN